VAAPGQRLRRDRVVVGVALALLAPALAYLGRLESSEIPTVEQLLPPAHAAVVRELRGRFGADSDLVLVLYRFTAAGPEPERHTRALAIERVIAGVPGVTQVFSRGSRPRLTLAGPEPRLVVAEGPHRDRPLSALDRFLAPPDGAALYVVTLDRSGATLTGARRILDELEHRLGGQRAPGEEVSFAGFPVQRVETWLQARRDVTHTLPLLVLAAAVVPVLFFRSAWAALLPLLMATLAATATVVAYRFVVGAVHPWVLLLIPLVWCIATMDTLHLWECAARRRAAGDPDPVTGAGRELALPCLITAIVTAASLLAMAAPGGPPLLRVFGVWGAIGTGLAFLLSFGVGGAVLRISGAGRLPRQGPSRLARAIIAGAERHPRTTASAWLVAAALSIAGLPWLRAESSYIRPFVAGHPFARQLEALRAATGSDLGPIEVYLQAEGARRDDPRALLLATVTLDRYLRTLPETRLSLSVATLATELLESEPRARAFLGGLRDPATARARARELASDPRLGPWVDLPTATTRTLLLLQPTDLGRLREILAWIDHFGRTMLDGFRVDFAGVGYLYQVAETEARVGLAWGLGGDLVLLALAFGVALRRPRAVAAGLLGNLIPVAILFGVMIVARVPWSLGLLALPFIVAGLAADDTVHLLWPARRAELPFATALSLAYRRFGSAAVATSVLVAACLASLAVSDFGASRALGWLFPTGILLALAAELTLVPALLALGRRRALTSSRRR
jgi:predicted RND superfamily exporter protein